MYPVYPPYVLPPPPPLPSMPFQSFPVQNPSTIPHTDTNQSEIGRLKRQIQALSRKTNQDNANDKRDEISMEVDTQSINQCGTLSEYFELTLHEECQLRSKDGTKVFLASLPAGSRIQFPQKIKMD
ncbi:hypothetical protein WR25_17225 [Diploscapter pachys]|uniref:Uncharacterized protein n=1 Tax=Diploscapter pachys TaxID=2018661 RepID=A0A2A2LSD5_9BILA|nr:hypothetical protein WR25_17225 [Diploscapter pachys]